MIGYWTNFARSGNPSGRGRGGAALGTTPFWPGHDAGAATLLWLMDRPVVIAAFRSAHQCPLWDRINPSGVY